MFNSFDSKLNNISSKSLEQVNFDSTEIFLLTAFNSSGIQILNNTDNTHTQLPTRVQKLQNVKVKSFVGKSSRSRAGCLCCKRRKKKCDEVKPICGSCRRLNMKCEFQIPRDDYSSPKPASKRKAKNTKTRTENDNQEGNTESSTSASLESETPQDTVLHDNEGIDFDINNFDGVDIFSNNTVSPYSMWDPSLKTPEFINFLTNPRFLFEPTDFLSQNLDQKGLLFFDYYRFNICEMISVSSDQENFFKTYFIKLAHQDISILYALAAWGGAFLVNGDEGSVHKYLQEAENSLAKRTKCNTRSDYMTILSFCLIAKGLNVSTGDTKLWFKYMKKFKNVLNEYGGLKKFCLDNIYENDAKWLISNFFFHDVINSHSLQNQTLIPLNDYITVFQEQKLLEVGNFGIDPSSGCITEAIVLLAEISSVRQSIKKMQNSINTFNTDFHELSSLLDLNINDMNMNSSLILNLKSVRRKSIKTFTEKISNIKPSTTRLVTVLDDYLLLELHLTFFELYQYVLRICVLIMIKGVKCDDEELTNVFHDMIVRFDIIIGSKLESGLCFPLLIIGMCCCLRSKREIFNDRYSLLCSSYMLKNVERMRDMVLKCWDIFDQESDITLDECLEKSKSILDGKVCFS